MASCCVVPSLSWAFAVSSRGSRGSPNHADPSRPNIGRGNGSCFLAPQVNQLREKAFRASKSNPPQRRRCLAISAAGGTNRPSWTEAAAGMGRGRTKGTARVPKPLKQIKQSGDPDAAGRESRSAAAASADTKRGKESFKRGTSGGGTARGRVVDGDERSEAGRGGRGSRGGRGAGRDAGRDAGRGSGTRGTNGYSGQRYSAELGGAAAQAAAKNAPTSNSRVTARNVDALLSFADDDDDDDPSLNWYEHSSDRETTAKPTKYSGTGFRLVRCMPHLRRREADDAVSQGRVLVNGELVKPSRRVMSGDVVTLDGKKMDWEGFAASTESAVTDASDFIYLKYHKPRGVTCTMEPSQRSSMLFALKDELSALTAMRKNGDDSGKLVPVRLFPVGRLDRDSSGLVLLTDDGRVPEALLDPTRKANKVYEVDLDSEVSEQALNKLRAGVVITTTQQRDGIATTAPTLPCTIDRIPCTPGAHSVCALRFTLKEGRNRQIRKMCETIGVDVTRLHRLSVRTARFPNPPHAVLSLTLVTVQTDYVDCCSYIVQYTPNTRLTLFV